VSLSAREQALFDWGRTTLPGWYADDARANEVLTAGAKVFGRVMDQVEDWLAVQTRILLADGPTSTTPHWLNQHAKERDTAQRSGESLDELRARLRTFSDAVTRPPIMASINALMAAASLPDAAAVELPRDQAYTGAFTSDSGTGGTFTSLGGGLMSFEPDTAFSGPPFSSIYGWTRALIISGAASAGNDGTFATTGVVGDGAKFANGTGVAGADATVSWTLEKKDSTGNVIDGFSMVYASRGYRCGGPLPVVIIILPFGTSDGLAAAVAELVRQRKAAGMRVVIERREIP